MMAQTYWERIAQTRWGRYIAAQESRTIHQAADLAQGPARALDIGCDGGRWAQVLVRQGWSVTCTDVREEALQLCSERVPGARCLRVEPDAAVLPVGDSSVSLVVCLEVTEVVQSAWFPGDAGRVLTPGGMLVVNTWNRVSARGAAVAAASRIRGRGPHPYYRLSYAHWRRRLRAAGFDLRSEQGMCWFPFGRASDSPLVPAAARLERGLGLHRLPAVSPWILVAAAWHGAGAGQAGRAGAGAADGERMGTARLDGKFSH
jgi:SAM-dependent methyltransferase